MLNDVFDPLGFLDSKSPAGFLEWMTIYERFRVHKSTCLVEITNRNGYCAMASLTPSGDSIVGGTVATAMTNTASVSTQIPPNTGNCLVRLVRTATAAQVLGVP